jgi:hypothetical protein
MDRLKRILTETGLTQVKWVLIQIMAIRFNLSTMESCPRPTLQLAWT